MSNVRERKILEELEKTGYPLEVDVSDALLENGWLIVPQYVTHDQHTGKLRTLDVWAARPFAKAGKMARMLVECKKSIKPWVFFQSGNLWRDVTLLQQKKTIPLTHLSYVGMTPLSLFQSFFDLEQINLASEKPSQVPTQLQELLQTSFQKIHFFDRSLPIAHSCYVAHRKGSKTADAFQKALYQLRAAASELAFAPFYASVFEVVVVRGDLYEFDKIEGKKQLHPVNHVLFYTEYLQQTEYEDEYITPANLKVVPPFTVDVVKDTYFAEYLRIISKDMECLEQIYTTWESVKP